VCGTTLRTYDPSIDAWHIQWTDPVTQSYVSMIGRAQGRDFVEFSARRARSASPFPIGGARVCWRLTRARRRGPRWARRV
jgi:hypothetical protein